MKNINIFLKETKFQQNSQTFGYKSNKFFIILLLLTVKEGRKIGSSFSIISYIEEKKTIYLLPY